MADDNNNDDGVFVYTEGAVVPDNVVRVRVHPSVTVIPYQAFLNQKKLEEVELCEGLVEIGLQAFMECKVLAEIRIPSTVKRISNQAFVSCVQIPQIRLPDGLESIGDYAFACIGNITNFRVPPLIVSIPPGMFSSCIGMFSVELSESVTQISQRATFSLCHSLRNIALTPDAEVVEEYNPRIHSDGTFNLCIDLLQLFGTTEQLINALKHRFDNLPVHKMIYYQSYNNVTSDQLNNATNIRISRRRSKLNPSGSQRDCLGTTPLHIMACSTVQNIELYKVLVDKYPETLITEDRWRALPLLYAVWGRAPDEIVQFLVESYKKTIYPNYVLNWTEMVKTLGIAGAPVEVIQNLLDLQDESFPDQLIDWDAVIERLSLIQSDPQYVSRRETFQFLVKCSFIGRINAIGLKHYRDNVMSMVMGPRFKMPYDVAEGTWLDDIRSKLSQYEDDYNKLKEATSLLELALWKMELDDHSKGQNKKGGRQNKKMKIDRNQYRVSCGADVVIQHILPYLLPSSSELDDIESELSESESDY